MIVAGLAPVLAAAAVAFYIWGPKTSQPSLINSSRSPAYDLYVRGKVKVTSVNLATTRLPSNFSNRL